MGGAGSAVGEALAAAGVLKPLLQLGLPDKFIEHGDPAQLLALLGLNAEGIARSIQQRFAPLLPPAHPTLKVVGILALLFNAVEHGNLEIGYERKAELLAARKFEEEIKQRLNAPLYANKKVKVSFTRDPKQLTIRLQDGGNGFNWREYINFEPRRMTDPNGRGIAMANVMEPGGLKYIGNGNELEYTLKLSR